MNDKTPAINIDFFGDLSLSGLFCDPQNLSQLKSSLSSIVADINTPDIRVVNWESPISESFDFHKEKSTILATNKIAAEVVTDTFKIDVAILGNNHIGDCRSEGLSTTTSLLAKKGIKHVGVGTSKNEALAPLILKKNNMSVGFISYVASDTNPRIEDDVNIHINILQPKLILEDIKKLKNQVDVIIVSLHWGKEFISYPSYKQRDFAKKLIELGANIIYGHHTHCLQGMEKWGNGLIFYSLGNFIFSGLKGKESFGWPKISTYSGYYKVFINKDKSMYAKFVPMTSENSKIHLSNDAKLYKKQLHLNRAFTYKPFIYNTYKILNTLNIWLIVLPYFFYKTKHGFIGVLKSIKKQHFSLLINAFLERK